jgi:hypothetical protein
MAQFDELEKIKYQPISWRVAEAGVFGAPALLQRSSCSAEGFKDQAPSTLPAPVQNHQRFSSQRMPFSPT